jgi:osmoprotectant transport system ATP-binding protein
MSTLPGGTAAVGSPAAGSPAVIQIEKARKEFPGGTVAVAGLDLDVREHELLVLVGPSGCGKSTTLRMVNRLVELTSGRVLVEGADIALGDPVALRRRIGYVIQDVGLFPHRTVEQNVATVPALLGWPKPRVRERTSALLDLVGLSPGTYARRYPHQLSGGEQQRVGVARALAADPPVLLMDEPFGAVDPVGRRRLQQEFWRIQRSLGTTVMLVTHDIDEAVRLGDRIAVFSRGGHLEQLADAVTLLAHPAPGMVTDFVGAGRTVRLLAITEITPDDLAPVGGEPRGQSPGPRALGEGDDELRLGSRLDGALAALLRAGPEGVLVRDGDRRLVGRLTSEGLLAALRRTVAGDDSGQDSGAGSRPETDEQSPVPMRAGVERLTESDA